MWYAICNDGQSVATSKFDKRSEAIDWGIYYMDILIYEDKPCSAAVELALKQHGRYVYEIGYEIIVVYEEDM